MHPITKKEIEITSPIPFKFKKMLNVSKRTVPFDTKIVSKPISRVLFKVIIYLGYVSLHTSCHPN